MSTRPVLEVKDLRVSYGKVEALHGVSLTVGAGQIVTVIGPNGAGKTTMLSAIMGAAAGSERRGSSSTARARSRARGRAHGARAA